MQFTCKADIVMLMIVLISDMPLQCNMQRRLQAAAAFHLPVLFFIHVLLAGQYQPPTAERAA
jgi:hypothetical protein